MTIQNRNWEMGRETRYFNGTLRKLRLERGWKQADLARLLGVNESLVSYWETLKSVPDKKYFPKFEEIFGMKAEDIFPEFLDLFKRRKVRQVEYGELTMDMLEAHGEEQKLLGRGGPTPEENIAKKGIKAMLEECVSQLSEREQKILTLRFGLKGERPHTLEEVGSEFYVTRDRIRQIEAKALYKLRRMPNMHTIREEAELAYDFPPAKER